MWWKCKDFPKTESMKKIKFIYICFFFLSYLMPSGSLISDSFSAQHCTPEGIDMKGIHLCKDRTHTYKPLNQPGK